MPIYEYYCDACHGKFKHLARRYNAPDPSCPRCGNGQVTRLVSAVNLAHGTGHHEQALRESAGQVDADDPQAIARFLKESGRLEDTDGVYGSRAYRELIERRAAGASEADLGDLVDDLVAQVGDSEAASTAGALVLSKQVENRMGAEGPAESEQDPPQGTERSPRSAENLGWG